MAALPIITALKHACLGLVSPMMRLTHCETDETGNTLATGGTNPLPVALTVGAVPSGGTAWRYASAGAIADTTAVAMKAAGGAAVRNYVTAVQLSNTDATVATIVQILSASTVLWQGYVPAQIAATAGSGVINIVFPTPLVSALNEAINVKCVTTSAEVYANAQGYTAP